MNNPPETPPTNIAPDTRAYVALLLAFSPLLVIYVLVWLRRGSISPWILILIAGLVVGGLFQLRSKTVTLGDREIAQGIRPFYRRIAYDDIRRIHHISVSSRYGSSPCLAISASPHSKDIVLPMRSFSRAKRVCVVQFIKMKAPQARIDPTVPT